MWNEKDVYIAAERYADMRRFAEQHNAAAHRRALEREEQRRAQLRIKGSHTIWQTVRKALALGSHYVYR